MSPYVFYQLWVMYGAPIRESTDEGSRKSLRALRNCTVVFWCCFPLVWLVVQLGLVGWRVEEILWSCADLCGKVRAAAEHASLCGTACSNYQGAAALLQAACLRLLLSFSLRVAPRVASIGCLLAALADADRVQLHAAARQLHDYRAPALHGHACGGGGKQVKAQAFEAVGLSGFGEQGEVQAFRSCGAGQGWGK